MPRPRTLITANSIPAADLAYAINALIGRGKTTAAEIQALASQRAARLAELRRELVALGDDSVAATPVRRGPGRRSKATVGSAKPKRKLKLSPKALAARKLQGQYFGHIRALTGAQRNEVKALAKKEGIAAGLKLALKYKAAAE